MVALVVLAPAWTLAAPPTDADAGDAGGTDDADDADDGRDAEGGEVFDDTDADADQALDDAPPEGDADAGTMADADAADLQPAERELPDVRGDGGCDIEDPGDLLYPVARALKTLDTAGASVDDCHQIADVLQGRYIETHLRGGDQALVLYVLEQLATDGYVVDLTPTGTKEVLARLRPSKTGERGVRFRGVDKTSVFGRYLPGDGPGRVSEFLGPTTPRFFPADVSARLAELGYRTSVHPVGRGEVAFEVQPGRTIRRVRVYGATPLRERELLRVLSIDARPGALARGRCVDPKELRKAERRPPICDAADLACRTWEKDEIKRIERFLFDSGYMSGTAELGLACGRDEDEADLQVYLDKGKAYKIARQGVTVTGEKVGDDRPWLRRQFTPRVLLVFRKRVTRTFMEDAKKDVEATYAEPSSYGRLVRSQDPLPYPQVEVNNSYEALDPETRENVPENRNLPLDVEIDLGRAVETSFAPPQQKDTQEKNLRFSKRTLDAQLQLFKRREQPNQAVASREAANLRVYYQSKGHLLARVNGFYEDFGELQKLRFEIEEGPRARIKDISLRSSKSVPPAVRRRIKQRWIRERELRNGRNFSESAALSDLGAVLEAYQEAGYLCASADISLAFWPDGLEQDGAHAKLDMGLLVRGGSEPAWLDQLDERGLAALGQQGRVPVYLRIAVDPGPRVLTSDDEHIRYLDDPVPLTRRVLDAPSGAEPNWGARRILHDTDLRPPGSDEPGDVPVTPEMGRDVRRTIIEKYRDNGYPVADAEVTFRYRRGQGSNATYVDLASPVDLVDPEQGICAARRNDLVVQLEPVVHVYEGKRGRFGDVSFRGNFKSRTYLFRRELEYERGDVYSQSAVQQSLAQMQGTDTIDGAQVSRYPVGCDLNEEDGDGPGSTDGSDECTVHQVITLKEKKDYAFDFRWGAGIQTLNPLYVKVAPRFPNLFGTGTDLDFEGLWGFDLPLEDTAICEGQDCYERRLTSTLLRPRLFGTGVSMDITGQFSRRVTPARGQIDAIFGNLRFQWTAKPGFSFFTGYLIQQANVSKDLVKPLAGSTSAWRNRREGIVTDLTGLIQLYGSWTNADNPFNPKRGIIVAVEGRLASPFLGGRDWWAGLDTTYQQFIPIPLTNDRLNFRYSLAYGHLFPFEGPLAKTETVPEVFRYYGGGTANLGLRGILPETMLVDVEEIPLSNGGVLYRPRAQGGHIRAIGTVALQFVSVKDFIGGELAHSIFYDFGVLTQKWEQVDLRRDYRHSIGLNFLKWDVNVVTIALGYGILIPTKNNVGPTDDKNGRFVFDVGVTF